MDRRFIQLFRLLSKQNDYIKAEELCAQLNIRPRTLREDIRQYKNTIEEEAGCCIESKPNAGYLLHICNEEKYNHFLKKLLQEESNNQYLIPVHQEERINYIIRYFLSHHDYVKLNDLADEIYVSRSTLNADIKEVKERLSYFHLSLASKAGYGLKITGKEKDIRSCIAQYFYHFDNYDQQYINGMDIHSSYIDQNAFAYIKNILYETISNYEFKLTDFGFQNLSIHIFIAVNRIMGKTYVEEYTEEPDYFKNSIEASIASDLAAKLNQYFHILVPSSEIHYITIHLMGKQSLHLNDQQFVLEQQTMDVTDKILQEIKHIYQIDFTKDFDLYSMITMHLQPMLKRMQYDLKISNPLTEQIKKDNPDAFEIAVLAGKVISRIFSKPVNEGELGYLALHFALALERLNKPAQKNVIIVCASGAGSSQILLYKVKSKFKDYINHVLVTQAYKLPEIDQSQYDLILSTIPLPFKTEIPVVQVQYFLDDSNISAIENILTDQHQDMDFIKKCFRKEFFFSHLKAKTREEAIALMCHKINAIHPLPDNFYQLVMEREAVSSTEFGNRIAVPHPIRLVMDETFVAVGILDKPIKWEKHHVKFIFMLCISKQSEEALSVFNEVLSGLILNTEKIQELDRHPDFQTIQRYIGGLAAEKTEQLKDSIFQ